MLYTFYSASTQITSEFLSSYHYISSTMFIKQSVYIVNRNLCISNNELNVRIISFVSILINCGAGILFLDDDGGDF